MIPTIGVHFTAAQERATEVLGRYRDTCVVAGPGSGKTTVLVEYFRRLVESGVDPVRILAITFTEKAAGNMRKKLAEAFQHSSDLRARLERAWVSTVHGFCARLLRENAVFAGLDPEFAVADERESWRMQQESIVATFDELFAEKPAQVRSLLRGLCGNGVEEAVLSAYDAMRGAGISVGRVAEFTAAAPVTVERVVWAIHELRQQRTHGWNAAQRAHFEEVLEAAAHFTEAARHDRPLELLRAVAALRSVPKLPKLPQGSAARELVKELRDTLLHDVEYLLVQRFYSRERALLLEVVARFDRRYRERKRQAGAVDFADLEEYTVRLLEENAAARARLRDQFECILMDEFQDTNGQQSKLLELMRAADRFYAVGDINQSIFGFRHAEPAVFAAYRDTVSAAGGRLVELTDNFRSRPQILSAVETVLHGADGIEPRALVAAREFDSETPYAVEVIACVADDADRALANEASQVAHRLRELAGPGRRHSFRDVAVLVRNTEVLGEFTAAFERAGIPHIVNRGRGFYESREVNDLTHLLRVIANPRDEISLAAVLRSGFAGVSDEALLALRGGGENLGLALARLAPADEAAFRPEDWRRLALFRDLLEGWRTRRQGYSFDRLLLNAMDECGYRPDSGERGSANIEKFLAQARSAAERMSLDEFVEELTLVRAEDPREADAPPEDSSDTVKLMTVHSAKGLEFPVVFIAALQKGIRGDLAVVEFSRHHGLGATWRNPVNGDSKVDLFQRAIRDERRQREREEGNRLLYVAMTRAEDHLVMTCSGAGRRPENWAATLAGSLGIDLITPRDELTACAAPDGKEWSLRVFCTADAPPDVPRPPAAEAVWEAELVDLPVAAEQYDTNATVTAVAAFHSCPRRYYLGHYLGWEGRVRRLEDGGVERELSADELGSQVHAILAGGPPAPDAPPPDPEAVRLAEVFHRSGLGRRAARARRTGRECGFMMAVGGLVLRGQIDLWFEEGGELVVVDYKTDDVNTHQAHDRALDYAIQLKLYAAALERIAGKPPDRAFLHFLRPDAAVEVDLTPSLLDSPEQVVSDLLDAQQRLEFPLREGSHCKRCPFFNGLCPAQ